MAPSMNKRLFVRCILYISCVLLLCSSMQGQNLYPDTGAAALYQRCQDVRGNLSVLNISLRPGDEDFQTLSYLRMERGCKLLSAYITNGEFSDCDSAELYPHQVAVVRRQEATSALALLESSVSFLNFPDIVTHTSNNDIATVWLRDTLEARLSRLIGLHKPDIILFGSSPSSYDSVLQSYVHKSILQAVGNLKDRKTGYIPWQVNHVLVRSYGEDGIKAPLSIVHPVWKQSYREIGKRIYREYRSIAEFRRERETDKWPRYQSVLSAKKRTVDIFRKDFHESLPPPLQTISAKIAGTIRNILDRKTVPNKYLPQLAALIDTVDRKLMGIQENQLRERRLFLSWKDGLEKLRTAILGVSVNYSLDYSIVTERQVLILKIDTMTNLPASGTTTIVFPSVDRDWVVNESKKSYLPLTMKEDYRILSPSTISYDLPAEQTFPKQPFIHRPFSVIIVHRDPQREKSFIYYLSPKIQYSPRFTAEVMTPLLRCIDGEKLILRLTNHSRDGVSDLLLVDDTLATSDNLQVTLPGKESVAMDTLTLSWNPALRDSMYLVPVRFGGVTITGFFGKKFSAKIDSSRSLALITGWQRSETGEALRRLGFHDLKVIRNEKLSEFALGSLPTIIIDRRATTLRPFDQEETRILNSFVINGGHLIVLAQDADWWNASPFIENVRLQPTTKWTVETSLTCDSTSSLFSLPNSITKDDFKNWIIRRAYNTIQCNTPDVRVLLSAEDRSPVILEKSRGRGKIVYIDAALSPQLMNIHEGVFRFLANIVAF
jgi:hypothetical protein